MNLLLQKIKNNFRLILRHAAISALCASTEFLIFLCSYNTLALNLQVSYIASFVSATMIGFVGHSLFTFRTGGFYKRNAFFFLLQASIALLLGYLILSNLIFWGVKAALAKIIQLGCVFFFNLSFGKLLSFKKAALK